MQKPPPGTLDDIVEGVVREYLHKKGFTKTLAQFNLEKVCVDSALDFRNDAL